MNIFAWKSRPLYVFHKASLSVSADTPTHDVFCCYCAICVFFLLNVERNKTSCLFCESSAFFILSAFNWVKHIGPSPPKLKRTMGNFDPRKKQRLGLLSVHVLACFFLCTDQEWILQAALKHLCCHDDKKKIRLYIVYFKCVYHLCRLEGDIAEVLVVSWDLFVYRLLRRFGSRSTFYLHLLFRWWVTFQKKLFWKAIIFNP